MFVSLSPQYTTYRHAWQGIGNGVPLAAVVTTPEIAAVMAQRLHFNTFGGNPVCSAAGHAVLKVIEEEKLQNNCSVTGAHLLQRLHALQEKHDSKGHTHFCFRVPCIDLTSLGTALLVLFVPCSGALNTVVWCLV